jgi:short-subunit dehydrogenase
MKEKVILIVGASSGIGKACAFELSKEGHIVFGTSRKVKNWEEIPVGEKKFYLLPMDVTDDQSIFQGVSKIVEKEGKIDVLIQNAGVGLAGPIEETQEKEAIWQFEVNFFGAFRVVKNILPIMRKRKNGLIVFISSLAGEFGLPFQSFYSASKAALNNFAEALQMECSFLKVAVVEPGDYRTSFPDNRVMVKGYNPEISFYKNCQIAIQKQEKAERQSGNPEEVAKLISKIIKNPSRFYYRVGKNAKIIGILGKILPRRLVIEAVAKHYGL